LLSEYDFTLRFDTSEVGLSPEECVERLAECGCDDALIGTGIPGRIALDFVRDAESAEEAVLGAIADVKTALPEATLVEAGPDFVGFTEVAEIVGRTRQNMRKLLLASSTPGPVPVHEGTSTVWHLAPVLRWLRDEKDYAIEQSEVELAEMTMRVNVAVTELEYGAMREDAIAEALSATGG
jgi:hypothetical protein